MAWTEITRPKYRRDGLRYASNTTDEEWALIEPLLPAPSERGRPRPLCQSSCRADRIGTFGGADSKQWLGTDRHTRTG